MLHISNFLLGRSCVTESSHFGLVFGKSSSENIIAIVLQVCHLQNKNINATPWFVICNFNTMQKLVKVSFVIRWRSKQTYCCTTFQQSKTKTNQSTLTIEKNNQATGKKKSYVYLQISFEAAGVKTFWTYAEATIIW